MPGSYDFDAFKPRPEEPAAGMIMGSGYADLRSVEAVRQLEEAEQEKKQEAEKRWEERENKNTWYFFLAAFSGVALLIGAILGVIIQFVRWGLGL